MHIQPFSENMVPKNHFQTMLGRVSYIVMGTILTALTIVHSSADDMEAIPVKQFIKHIMELYKNNMQGFAEEFEVHLQCCFHIDWCLLHFRVQFRMNCFTMVHVNI